MESPSAATLFSIWVVGLGVGVGVGVGDWVPGTGTSLGFAVVTKPEPARTALPLPRLAVGQPSFLLMQFWTHMPITWLSQAPTQVARRVMPGCAPCTASSDEKRQFARPPSTV